MSERKRRRAGVRRSGVGTGTISLLMIFTVLCFATLAMLSLSTAASSERIQARGMENATGTIEAKGLAAAEVAALDAELLALQKSYEGQTQDAQEGYLTAACDAAESRGWAVDRETAAITLRTEIEGGHVLVTELQLLELGKEGRYEVLRQATEIEGGWTPEAGGQVWDGSA